MRRVASDAETYLQNGNVYKSLTTTGTLEKVLYGLLRAGCAAFLAVSSRSECTAGCVDDVPATIFYTSGSTAGPKGCEARCELKTKQNTAKHCPLVGFSDASSRVRSLIRMRYVLGCSDVDCSDY